MKRLLVSEFRTYNKYRDGKLVGGLRDSSALQALWTSWRRPALAWLLILASTAPTLVWG